jgi:D-sedoheptulose 7-phosphate isomerase
VSDLSRFFDQQFDEHEAVARATRAACGTSFAALVAAARETIARGGKILFFGNGGSAADAQHLATELTVRYAKNRKAIAALSLSTDTSALTAIGNDFGFEHLFARQIEALGKQGDLAIGISTSGKSPNVIEALRVAKAMGLTAAALSGHDGGALPGLASPLVLVPSKTTARIQEMHILLGQMLCDVLEQDALNG